MDISSLTLEQKIMQTKVDLMKKGEKIKGNPGGVFFFGQIITEAEDTGLDELRSYVDEVYDNAQIPPLITSDFENGCGSMVKGLTPLPYLMGLGASEDEKLAYSYGKATALEALSIGANWSFSPVSDLNINKRNPLVNVRALTDNPDLAVKMLRQVICGMQENGLAACAKHFPGDGVDYRDQHIVTTSNSFTKDKWNKTYGRVFSELIKSGVDSVMVGHIAFPDYTTERDPDFNMPYPATLSKEIVTDLLKNELGFKGVVVTDSLRMGGINGWYDSWERKEIEAFKAGCDMLLWPTESYEENMKKAIESGYISMERLDDAVSRILALKEKLNLFDKSKPRFRQLSSEERQFVKNTQEEAAKKGMTLVRNMKNILPLDNNKAKKILLVPVTNYEPAYSCAELLRDRLSARAEEVIYMPKTDLNSFYKNAQDADTVIFAMFSRSFRPIGFLDYYAEAAQSLQWALSVCADKTVCVSFGSPYFFKQYFERAYTFVNAYSMLDCQVEAFVKALFGEEDFGHNSPVCL